MVVTRAVGLLGEDLVADRAAVPVEADVGYQILAFVAILALCGIAMWRTWREQHTYV